MILPSSLRELASDSLSEAEEQADDLELERELSKSSS